MPKLNLIVYSQDLPNCSCFGSIVNNAFNTESVGTSEQFLHKVNTLGSDGAIVCFCSAHEDDPEKLLHLKSLAGLLPVLTCSKTLSPDFVRSAAEQGAQCFLCCAWEASKIVTTILEAIQREAIEELLNVCNHGRLTSSPHVSKIIRAIIHTFPHRLREGEMARQLGMSQRWLRMLCRQAFNRTYVQLRRRIFVHQALRMMKHTNLDNIEIAMQLNYSEEGSMFRDFRKELGFSSAEARKRLACCTPEELLLIKKP
jgi:AraC-like DNA-binding protein